MKMPKQPIQRAPCRSNPVAGALSSFGCVTIAWILSTLSIHAQPRPDSVSTSESDPAAAQSFQVVAETPFAIAERGAHHRLWKKSVTLWNAFTGEVQQQERSYTELCDGLHYWAGEWKESQELIELAPTGEAVARHGLVQVIFRPSILTPVESSSPDGKRLRSQVVGLYLIDALSGQSVPIAAVKDSVGELLPPNQVFYPDCFDGLRADVRFTYRRSGLEQDVILRQRPALPEGWQPAHARLAVVTEFLDPPVPQIREIILKKEEDPAKRVQMAMPDLINQDLNFGGVQMFLGRAFSVEGEQTDNGLPMIPIAKTWWQAEGRTFLTEQVEHEAIAPLLRDLPQASNRKVGELRMARLEQLIAPVAGKSQKAGSFQVAKNTRSAREKGVVIDWRTVTNASTYTFASGQTYLVTNSVTISSSTIIESNAVIKFESNAVLTLSGTVTSPATDLAFFTARDDDSIGEPIPGSPITGNAANPALNIYNVG
ncbi:MAG TPA: hypothetical protein VFA77_05155, partial [Candidatus Eisenbacteria bacterium]|nr:hypothetical protein [Candidatus Eisenbacteria bacterium]